MNRYFHFPPERLDKRVIVFEGGSEVGYSWWNSDPPGKPRRHDVEWTLGEMDLLAKEIPRQKAQRIVKGVP